jgi:hypothetical protein
MNSGAGKRKEVPKSDGDFQEHNCSGIALIGMPIIFAPHPEI